MKDFRECRRTNRRLNQESEFENLHPRTLIWSVSEDNSGKLKDKIRITHSHWKSLTVLLRHKYIPQNNFRTQLFFSALCAELRLVKTKIYSHGYSSVFCFIARGIKPLTFNHLINLKDIHAEQILHCKLLWRRDQDKKSGSELYI